MTEQWIESLDDPDVDLSRGRDVALLLRGRLVGRQRGDAARNAAGHQIGDTALAELLGVDPHDAPSDTDVEHYIVGVPILAEEDPAADPAAWAWLTEVHKRLADSTNDRSWRTEITRRGLGVVIAHPRRWWLAS